MVRYSRYRGMEFDKNVLRFENKYLTGVLDIGERGPKGEIYRTIDIKNRYTVKTHYEKLVTGISPADAAQLETYNLLAGSSEAEIANILENNHPEEIQKILQWEGMKYRDPDDPEKLVFDLPLWKKIRILKQHVFDRQTLDSYLVGELFDADALDEYESFVEIPDKERVIRQIKEADYELQERIIRACKAGIEYLREHWNIENIE